MEQRAQHHCVIQVTTAARGLLSISAIESRHGAEYFGFIVRSIQSSMMEVWVFLILKAQYRSKSLFCRLLHLQDGPTFMSSLAPGARAARVAVEGSDDTSVITLITG